MVIYTAACAKPPPLSLPYDVLQSNPETIDEHSFRGVSDAEIGVLSVVNHETSS